MYVCLYTYINTLHIKYIHTCKPNLKRMIATFSTGPSMSGQNSTSKTLKVCQCMYVCINDYVCLCMYVCMYV